MAEFVLGKLDHGFSTAMWLLPTVNKVMHYNEMQVWHDKELWVVLINNKYFCICTPRGIIILYTLL